MTNKRTWTINQLEKAISSSNCMADVLKKLGLGIFRGNYQTVYKYIKMLNIDISHLIKRKSSGFNEKIPIEEVLIENSTYDRGSMRRRIIKENIINYKCGECGIVDMWRGKEIRLQVDHINGVWNDNRIKNLRFLCPNCHSQTENWSGKNNKKTSKCSCGKIILKSSTFCHSCAAKRQKNKIGWPPVEQLVEMVNGASFVAIAKKLGVSDNAIRKRIKNHSYK